MKSVPTIAFDCRPSRTLLLATMVFAVLALVAIVLCGLPAWLKFVSALIVAVYATHSLRKLLASAFAQVMWHPAGHWRLRHATGSECVGELVHSVVLGALIVLVLRIDAKRTTALPLLPDNCDAETRRRLRVRLARSSSIDPAT
jgi:toxin CptA